MPNPWLSEVSRMAGTMRGQVTAQAKRRSSAVVNKAINDNVNPQALRMTS